MQGSALAMGDFAPLLDGGGFCNRQTDREDRAVPVASIGSGDLSAMGLDKSAADRQSEAGAGALPVGAVHAVELVEDALQRIRRYAGPFVAHLDDEVGAIMPA